MILRKALSQGFPLTAYLCKVGGGSVKRTVLFSGELKGWSGGGETATFDQSIRDFDFLLITTGSEGDHLRVTTKILPTDDIVLDTKPERYVLDSTWIDSDWHSFLSVYFATEYTMAVGHVTRTGYLWSNPCVLKVEGIKF